VVSIISEDVNVGIV